jgi:uncharacterized small protein (TIGR04563 family)
VTWRHVNRKTVPVQARFEPDDLDDIRQEAKRLDRSISWVMQRAWEIGRDSVSRLPSDEEPE